MRRWLGVLAILLGLALGAAADLKPLTILYTTDLHGHAGDSKDEITGAVGGGILRCASYVEEVRKAVTNVLLLDNGDTLQGSAESWLSRGQVMVQALEGMRYDAWNLGNHEWDWGWSNVAAVCNGARLPVLNANLIPPATNNPLTNHVAWIIREVGGVRVAVVGLTTPGIPSWSLPQLLDGFTVEDSVAALRRVLPEVRKQNPDVMVLAVHQGLRPRGDDFASQVRQIAERFPDFSVILGGHLHQPETPSRLYDALYLQAGSGGFFMGRADLMVDTDKHAVAGKQARLVEIGARFPPQPELKKKLQPYLDRAGDYLARGIGAAAAPFPATTKSPGQSPVQQLICRAMAEAVGVDLVLNGIFVEDHLEAGPLAVRDAWKIVPYENRIGVIRITGDQIRAALDENADQIRSTRFMGVFGMSYTLDPLAEPGRRVSDMRLADGTPIAATNFYRVAVGSYNLASGGRRFNELRRLADDPAAGLALTELEIRDAVIAWIEKHSPIRPDQGPAVSVLSARRKASAPSPVREPSAGTNVSARPERRGADN